MRTRSTIMEHVNKIVATKRCFLVCEGSENVYIEIVLKRGRIALNHSFALLAH